MLPDGFHWQATSYGYHLLRMDGQIVVEICADRAGPYVLAYLHCGLTSYRGRTFASEAEARRYLEAWACKWQARIREAYGLPAHDPLTASDGRCGSDFAGAGQL